jgi:hypothetical protein
MPALRRHDGLSGHEEEGRVALVRLRDCRRPLNANVFGGREPNNVAGPQTRRTETFAICDGECKWDPGGRDLPGAVTSPRSRAARAPLTRSALEPNRLRALRGRDW